MFLPSLNFLSSCKAKLKESESVISPLSKAALRFQSSKPLSLTSISAVCKLDRENTAAHLRSIVS